MTNTAGIPIHDLCGDEATVAKQLVDAAVEHGFIYIRNQGKDITAKQIDGAFDISGKLFNAPVAEKQRCAIQTNNRGWAGLHGETLDPTNSRVGDFKESVSTFNFGEFVDGKAQQPIPSTVMEDESQISEFSSSCHALCCRILYLLGLGLGVDDFFSSAHDPANGPSTAVLRFLRYPPPDTTNHEADDVRAGAHSDYGSITLLFRLKGQAGLELLTKQNEWHPVPVCPPGTENDAGGPPILVNIGDLLSYWTGGLFRSTVHRVVFPTAGQAGVDGESSDGVRYSIAYFGQPVGSVKLEPVPSERVRNFVPENKRHEMNPYAEKRVLTADEHLLMRLKATYGSLYDEKK